MFITSILFYYNNSECRYFLGGIFRRQKYFRIRNTSTQCMLVCGLHRRNNFKMFRFSGHFFGNIPYNEARRTCNILSLAERRHELGKRFFQRIIEDKSNVLFYLLPAKRDVQLTTRLRRARQHPTIYARTNRYKNSFILFRLNHSQ